MKVETITLQVGDGEFIETKAYIYLPKGLAIHRAFFWTPGEDPRETASFDRNNWTVTHIPTSLSIVNSQLYLGSIEECEAFCRELMQLEGENGPADWTKEEIRDVLEPQQVRDARLRVRKGDAPERSLGAQAGSQRFVVRANPTSRGFHVFDVVDEEVIQHFPHRGLARRHANELSKDESI